jgi:hypothetical protein
VLLKVSAQPGFKRARDFWIGRCALKKKENIERGDDLIVF